MNLAYAAGRVALVAMFIFSGVVKLLDIAGTAAQISSKVAIPFVLTDLVVQIETAVGMPRYELMAIAAGVIEILGGLLIAFNVLTRTSAIVLLLYTIAATFYFNDFWNMPAGTDRTSNMAHALKNLSLVGAFLILAALPRRIWVTESEPAGIDERPVVVHEGDIRP
jgi:uncharacterized membrane protein YphA (DoxX/SURF4 family)